ncbi:hemin uptake protein HemP [Zoogloea sp.]|uniref:hemin uptake protein HemP n=1 Tax=Zoogloea sp. TaxID=49181 RepID=UPI0035AF778B
MNTPPSPVNPPKPDSPPLLHQGLIEAPICSKDLFNDRTCVYIEHEGMLYALRATRAGKLILTK